MSLVDALHDWKQLATTASELNVLQQRVAQLQTTHDTARMQFEQELDELDEDERDSILAIMSVYEHFPRSDAPTHDSSEASGGRSATLEWLVNKVGNEGTEGICWTDIVDAWQVQHPDTPANVIHGLLHRHNGLFVKNGMGKQAVLKLTAEGQSMFLGG